MKSRQRRSITRRSKACLCLMLILNLQWMHTGCGTIDPGAATTMRQRVEIDPASPLGESLAQTSAAGAKWLELERATGAFRLTDADGVPLVSGQFDISEVVPVVTQLVIHGDNRKVEVDFDGSRRITSIRAADDSAWSRTDDKQSSTSARVKDTLLDANRDLLAVAADMDAGKYDTSSQQSKVDPQLASMLSIVSALLVPVGGVLSPLLVMFSIITSIEAMNVMAAEPPAGDEPPQMQVGVSGAYLIEYAADAANPRRLTLSEFDTDRSLTLLGAPGESPSNIILRGADGAVMHVVTDGKGGLIGIRSGSTLLLLGGTPDQITAYFADTSEGGFASTNYLAYEIVDLLNELSAEPRNGPADGTGCQPIDSNATAGFSIPGDGLLSIVAQDAGLAGDDSFCAPLSIYAAVLEALDRDGFVDAASPSQRELVGWGVVAEEAGVCKALSTKTQTCTQMSVSTDDMTNETASDAEVLKTTQDAATRLLKALPATGNDALRKSLEQMVKRSQ